MPAPPPESDPAMVSSRGGVSRKLMPSGGARLEPAAAHPGDHQDCRQKDDADHLSQRPESEETVVLGAQDFDQESLDGQQAEDYQSHLPGGSVVLLPPAE